MKAMSWTEVLRVGMPVLIAILILIVGTFLIKFVCRVTLKALQRSKLDPVLFTFAVNCIKILMWIVVGLTALNYLGIPPTSILTVIGAAGVAVALALQSSLSNFAGGVLIIVTKPFSKGDFIDNLTIKGKVEHIDLLCTTLITFDNKIITIPNGTLANNTIVNYSRAENRRVDFAFNIAYEEDVERAKDMLLAIAENNESVFKDPAPFVGVGAHLESSVGLDFRVWCKNEDYWDVFYYVNEQVKAAFDEHSISIPYPQIDVHMRKA